MVNGGVAGTGYVGLSIATLLSQHHQVTAVDIVPARKGKFKVSVSLMCSEYIEPKVHDIEFEIV